MPALLRRLLAVADSDVLRGPLWHVFYEWLAARQPESFSMMNYGFADLDATICPEDGDALGLRLYDEVVGATDLTGRRLLEVGCGRAGGLLHLARRWQLHVACGVDFSRRAVALAQRRTAHLPFVRILPGNADALPLGPGSFDVVLNVESSHCYPSRPRFFGEVARVLIPGGTFLYADLFPGDAIGPVRTALGDAGLVIAEEHDITDHVTAALRLDEGRRVALVQKNLPRALHGSLRAFAGTTESPMYRSFIDGRRRYLRFVAVRAALSGRR
jgi:SAM-dependent methyltransferase